MEAKAQIKNVDMSAKYSREMALAIKGKKISRARKVLEGVISLEKPIELKRHNKEVPHKYGKPSRYPVKVAKNFVELLDSAIENAKYKGADESRLFISNVHVTRGYHKRTMGSKALGKAKVRSRRANVLLVLSEKEKSAKKVVKKAAKKVKKKEEKKK